MAIVIARMVPDEAEKWADSLDEVKVCDICGAEGFDDCLAVCNQCNEGAEHVYCMVAIPDIVPLDWVCGRCKENEKKNSAKKRFACDGLLSMRAHKKQNVGRESVKTVFENIGSVQTSPSKQNSIENGAEHYILKQADKAPLTGLSCRLLPTGDESVNDTSSAGTKQLASGSSSKTHMKKFGSKGSPGFALRTSVENIGPKPNSSFENIGSVQTSSAKQNSIENGAEHYISMQADTAPLGGLSCRVLPAGSESVKDTSSAGTKQPASESSPKTYMKKFGSKGSPSSTLKTIVENTGPKPNSPFENIGSVQTSPLEQNSVEDGAEHYISMQADKATLRGGSCRLLPTGGQSVKDTSSAGTKQPASESSPKSHMNKFGSKGPLSFTSKTVVENIGSKPNSLFENIASVQNSPSKQNFIENEAEHHMSMQADKAPLGGLSCRLLPAGSESVKDTSSAGTKQLASRSTPKIHMKEFGSKGLSSFTSETTVENIEPKPNSLFENIQTSPSKQNSIENGAEHYISMQAVKAPLSGISCQLLPAGGDSVKDASSVATKELASGSSPKTHMKKLGSKASPSFTSKTIVENIGPKPNSPFKNIGSVQASLSKQKSIENGAEHYISDKASLSGLSCQLLPTEGESVKDTSSAGTKQLISGSSPMTHMKEFRSNSSPSFTTKTVVENIGPKPASPFKVVSAESATAEHTIVKQNCETAALLEGEVRVKGASGPVVLAGGESKKGTSSAIIDKVVIRGSRPQADTGKIIRRDSPIVSPKTITEKIGPNSNSPSKGKSAGEVAAPSEGVKGSSCLPGSVGGVYVKDTSSSEIVKQVSGSGTQAYEEIFTSKGSTILPNSTCEEKPAGKAGHHILKQGGESVILSSFLPRKRSRWLVSVQGGSVKDAVIAGSDKLASVSSAALIQADSALERNVDNADKDSLNHIKVSPNKPTSGSQHALSKSMSMKAGDIQPSSLFPSRPKILTRSKSAVVQSSIVWANDLTRRSPNRQENLVTVIGKDHDDCGFHARREASDRIDSIKSSLAGSRPRTQAGVDAGFRNVKYDQSSKGSETSRYWGQKSGFHIGAHNRCHRCNEVGHLAEMCKGVSNGRLREWRTSEIPASGEKGLLGNRPDPIQVNRPFQGSFDERRFWRHDIRPIKEEEFSRTISRSELHAVDCVKICSRQSPKSSEHTRIVEKYRHEIQPRKESRFERNRSRSERSHVVDCVKMGSKPYPKPSGYARVHEKQIVRVQGLDRSKAHIVASSPPAHPSPVTSPPKIGKHSPHKGNATLQQAGPVEALRGAQGRQSNQVVLYNWQDEHGKRTSISNSRADLAFGSRCPGADNFFLGMRAIPGLQMLWSGCFNVSSSTSCSASYRGMQAHPSNRADPKVFEAMMALPVELNLDELKRGVETDSWPRSFQEHPPTCNSIGIYFFPVDMESHDTWYKPLLDRLSAHDLALRIKLEFAQLLIFPSQLLPEAEQCWDDRQYLWGIFRTNKGKEAVKVLSPGEPLALGLPSNGDHGNDSGSPKGNGEVIDMDVDMVGGEDVGLPELETLSPPLPPGFPPAQPPSP